MNKTELTYENYEEAISKEANKWMRNHMIGLFLSFSTVTSPGS